MDSTNSKNSKKVSSFPQRPVAQLLGSNGPIHAVSYSAFPGSYILTGSADRSIRLYNPSPSTSTSTSVNTTAAGSSSLLSSSYITTSSQTLPITTNTNTTIPEGRLIQTYTGHGYEVLSLSVASDNARFASSGGDRAVYLWDVATAQTTRRFGATAHGHSGRVNAVAFGGVDDSLIVSGGLDTTVRIWDTKSGSAGGAKPVMVLGDARDAVTSVVVNTGGGKNEAAAEVITGSVDGRVRTYDVRAAKCVTDVMPSSVTSLYLSGDGRTVLVGTLDSKIRLMDRRDGTCLRTYGDEGWRNEEFRVQSCFGGGERFVVAGDELTGGNGLESNEGRVWAWDLLTGRLAAKISVPWGGGEGSSSSKRQHDARGKERKNVISCLAWKEDGFGNQFCVGGTSGVVTVFGE